MFLTPTRPLVQAPLFNTDPLAPAAGTGGSGRIKCDFCHCVLAGDGAVLKTSERAKALAKVEDAQVELAAKLQAATTDANDLRTQIATLQAQLDARPPAAAPERDEDW